MNDDDDSKLDLQAIIDIANDFARQMDAMEMAYRRADMKELLRLLEKLFHIEKESVH